jgi:hypothetical protein
MTRPLLIVFACAMIVCFASFVAASAVGPLPSARWWSEHLDTDVDDGDFGFHPAEGGGPPATRTLTWEGREELEVNVPARIVYTQGAEPSFVVTGPSRTLDALELDGETLRFTRKVRNAGRITVTMTAPLVRKFELNGAQELSIANFDQDRLEVSVRGAGEVVGHGRADQVDVEIMGAGEVDLGGVAARMAEVRIAGAGEATVSPTESVEVNIAGAGDVNLTTRPARVEQHFAGAGSINYTEAAAAPAPATPPTPRTPSTTPTPPTVGAT